MSEEQKPLFNFENLESLPSNLGNKDSIMINIKAIA
jgi:hypothetical protein